MRHMDFVSCPEDPDFWMRPDKNSDRSYYYKYDILYNDEVLIISKNTEILFREVISRIL